MPPVFRFLPLTLLIAAAAPIHSLPAGLEPGGSATVSAVVDGDTVVLEDGRQVRLVGIQAPKLPLGRPGYATWPLAPEAKAELVDLVLGREVMLGFGGARRDRNGRVLAHLFRASDGLWIQGEMLARGLARVYTFADNRALASALYAQELNARSSRRGLWALPYYAILTADQALSARDSFALIEGQVHDARVIRGTGYLNFGPDWKTDFTIRIRPKALQLFTKEGIAVPSYSGRRVRVRGWVESLNGPMIEVTHPEQIEEIRE